MNQKMKKYKGMTIVETLIATLLFGVFTLVLVQMLISSSRSFVRGRNMHEVRSRTASVIQIIQTEINQSIILPTTGDGLSVPSTILLPNAYGVGNGLAAEDGGSGVSYDRLVLSIPYNDIESMSTATMTSDIVNNVRFVEYVVPSAQKNVLNRNVYSIEPLSTSDGYYGFRQVGGKWLVDDGQMSTKLVDSSQVAYLNGTHDYITMKAIRYPQVDSSLGTQYNVYLVKLKLRMTKYISNNRSVFNSREVAPERTSNCVTYEETAEGKVWVKHIGDVL